MTPLLRLGSLESRATVTGMAGTPQYSLFSCQVGLSVGALLRPVPNAPCLSSRRAHRPSVRWHGPDDRHLRRVPEPQSRQPDRVLQRVLRLAADRTEPDRARRPDAVRSDRLQHGRLGRGDQPRCRMGARDRPRRTHRLGAREDQFRRRHPQRTEVRGRQQPRQHHLDELRRERELPRHRDHARLPRRLRERDQKEHHSLRLLGRRRRRLVDLRREAHG